MSIQLKISIIDYGVGNLHSLIKGVQQFTKNVQVTDEAEEIETSSALILPGVGAFAAGMEGLEVRGLVNKIKEAAQSGKPILGICLGAQIMLSMGFEFGEFAGLDLISGKVVEFPVLPEAEKIPHMGWNKIYSGPNDNWENSILNNIAQNSSVYFVHSYILEPKDKTSILAMANYGGYEFCAAIRRENIFGLQFHPEKSGEVGLNIIKNFIQLSQNHA